ncbi:ParB/RepB/Spo0J family partition protein [Polaromonas sp.]|uniref:ParB/RepB/Spo0J family partition protein n=1 Tax=Polaromonas sp. TaxID=1869339 RepID=UPI00352A52D2
MSERKVSVKDRAFQATAGLNVPSTGQGAPAPTRSRTGPGTMVAHLATESKALVENSELRAQLMEYEGSLIAKPLDPTLVSRSEYTNRHTDTFFGPAFEELKLEIRGTGGNQVPGKVRPIPGTNPQQYLVVWGQRRHQACLEEGLPFTAIIESLTDKAAFKEADRENRAREDLRPYEQGMSYLKALEKKLYPSVRALADDLEVSASAAAMAVRLAKLPEVVLDAFPSRLDLQFRWTSDLSDTVEKEPELIESAAKEILAERKAGKAIPAAEVFARLVRKPQKPAAQAIEIRGKKLVSITAKGGRHVFAFEKDVLDATRLSKLQEAIKKILA